MLARLFRRFRRRGRRQQEDLDNTVPPTPNDTEENLSASTSSSYTLKATKIYVNKPVEYLKNQSRGILKHSNRKFLSRSQRSSSLKKVSIASELPDKEDEFKSSPLQKGKSADGKQSEPGYFVDKVEFNPNYFSNETFGSFSNKSAGDNEFDFEHLSDADMEEIIDRLTDAPTLDISHFAQAEPSREEQEDVSEFSTLSDDRTQEEMDEVITRLTLAASKDLSHFVEIEGEDGSEEEYDEAHEEEIRVSLKVAAREKIRYNRKNRQMSDREKMDVVMAALNNASSKDALHSGAAEADAGQGAKEVIEDDTLIGDDFDKAESKVHVGNYQTTADETKEPKKTLIPAWIPVSRFNLSHPTAVTIKPSKPLFTPLNPMSRQERNIYRTDLLTALHTQQQNLKEMRLDRCEYIKKEVVAVLEALDLVSARQEYISLMVQMFKEEPHKLTQEFKDVIEFRLLQHNKEERAVIVRFAKLEVEWEKVLAMDEEMEENAATIAADNFALAA